MLQTDCGNGVTSYGRRKRQADVLQEMPLQLAIIVREPTIVAENRTSNNDPSVPIGKLSNQCEVILIEIFIFPNPYLYIKTMDYIPNVIVLFL